MSLSWRVDIIGLLGVSERQARRITSALVDSGIVTSKSSRAPLYLAFPARLARGLCRGFSLKCRMTQKNRRRMARVNQVGQLHTEDVLLGRLSIVLRSHRRHPKLQGDRA